jgi:hypothetical protein
MNEAYLDLLERHSKRGLRLLPDRARNVEREQRDYLRRRELADEFGSWIAYSLGPWDWFINPVTFRDRHPDLERNPKTGEKRSYRVIKQVGPVKILVDDPRLKGWKPQSRGCQCPGPPVPDKALVELKDWLLELQEAADRPIRWMIGEEFGDIEARYHCHLLVAGVAHLRRDEWWQKAFDQFGRTQILPFDPEKGGAFYAAKYAAKKLGALHFGGPLPDAEFSALLSPPPQIGRLSATPSAQMPREQFRRFEFYPRGWAGWRSKR